MTKRLLSITETPNKLTNDIDIASPTGIVRILRQSDSQIFNGWRDFPSLSDEEIQKKIEQCVFELIGLFKSKGKKAIIISGAGTSGRLAMYVSRTFNLLLKKKGLEPIFHYLIAGGNLALIVAQEGAEDNPRQAVTDLRKITDSADKIYYVSVTCGFSAPYVASQLFYLQNVKNSFNILFGFNPVERSRNVPIENWDKTFLDAVKSIEKKKNFLILNPILGPEPITGSTRMKGGSATKIVLDIIFSIALIKLGVIKKEEISVPEIKPNMPINEMIKIMLDEYENIRKKTYEELNDIAKLIKVAGKALRAKSHIYYLGKTPEGILGNVDASECPPTFGADFEDVRGFVIGGWKKFLIDGEDLSNVGPLYRIDTNEFINTKLRGLKKTDVVIGIGEKKLDNEIINILKQSERKGANIGAIIINGSRKNIKPNYLNILPQLRTLGIAKEIPTFTEFSLKLILNAITTGGHILSGKIYQNRMIDLRISNNKLFYRTIGIISKIMGVKEEFARECLLKSIYETDKLTEKIIKAPISEHINVGSKKEKIVPRALLLATGNFNISSATKAIKKEPIVRNIIEKITLN